MIETRGLTKVYGDDRALDGVDVDVAAGEIYGLVGPNGAGKSTLLGILAGLRRATSGSVRVDAEPGAVGVLPDTPRFDPWLTGREVVALAAHLAGGVDDVEDTLAAAGLADAMDRAVGGYSRGMLQRLGMAATVVSRPSLILLDEPASALDPLGRREVLDLVARLRGSATILFSSHILADVQEVCDTIGILDRGRLVFQGTIEELLVGRAVPRLLVRVRPPVDPLLDGLAAADWVVDVEPLAPDLLAVTVASLEDAVERVAAAIAAARVRLVSVAPEAVTLERAFLEVTR